MSANGKHLGAAFSPDFSTARDRFRSLAGARGCRLETLPIGKKGPNGADLSLDAAILGPRAPRRAVVVSSGLHGVEGFFGAAVQLAILQSMPEGWTPPDDSALLFLHALDPYGFAWVRRFDEDNVDLNRNFLIDGAVFQGSPKRYAELNDLINPSYAPSYFDPFWPKALWAICRYGLTDLKQAVARGQYDFPRGLFFGGHTPSLLQRLLAQHLPRWLDGATAALHLDFHTGLGPWATYQLLLEPNLAGERVRWLKERFGAENVQISEPEGIAYRSQGGLGPWCQALLPACRYDYLCAEFGTYSTVRVLAALRAENQSYHWAAPDDPNVQAAKAWLKEVFVPADPHWREQTIRQGLEVVDRAFNAVFGAATDHFTALSLEGAAFKLDCQYRTRFARLTLPIAPKAIARAWHPAPGIKKDRHD